MPETNVNINNGEKDIWASSFARISATICDPNFDTFDSNLAVFKKKQPIFSLGKKGHHGSRVGK